MRSVWNVVPIVYNIICFGCFLGIDSCLMVTKRDFLEMEASL